jgi:hypothetical protein
VFSPDGRRVLTASAGTAWVWDVSPDDRPVADVVGLAQVRSGHRVDNTGAVVPLTTDELTRLWADLHDKYPAEFSVTPHSVRWWREGEIRACVREGNLTAAEFHLWWLGRGAGVGEGKVGADNHRWGTMS